MVVAVAIVGGLTLVAMSGATRQAPTIYAYVDGVAIDETAYTEYASVFTTPEGGLRVSREMILLSLINQALVEREGQRRGISVSEDDVRIAAEAMASLPIVGKSIDDEAGAEGLRARIRMFALFQKIKSLVVGPVVISTADLEKAYADDPGLQAVGFGAAGPILRERLAERETERRWSAWLRVARECAEVQVLEKSFDLTSTTPRPDCPSN